MIYQRKVIKENIKGTPIGVPLVLYLTIYYDI